MFTLMMSDAMSKVARRTCLDHRETDNKQKAKLISGGRGKYQQANEILEIAAKSLIEQKLARDLNS